MQTLSMKLIVILYPFGKRESESVQCNVAFISNYSVGSTAVEN